MALSKLEFSIITGFINQLNYNNDELNKAIIIGEAK